MLGYKLCRVLACKAKHLLAKETISTRHRLLDQLCGFTGAEEFREVPLTLNFQDTLDKLIRQRPRTANGRL